MKMPSRADVAARRTEVFKDTIRKTIADGDLDTYVELVEHLAEEGPFDVTDIAAAAVKLATVTRPPVAISAPPPAAVETSLSGRTVTLSLAVGKREGIRPADIVGSIANEADVPGRDIGPIEIRDEITYVGIPERYVDVVISKVGKKKFRGKALNLRVAEHVPAPRPARSFEDRPPRPPYRKPAASSEDRPPRREDARPNYPPRPARPARSFDDRPARPRDDDRPAYRKSAPASASADRPPRKPAPFYEKGGFKGKKKGR
jgi:hypothetical protein